MGLGFRYGTSKETAMNASLRIAALVLTSAGLTACAGSMEKSTYESPGVIGSYAADSGYVSNVERIARRSGAQVTWVNVPIKRATNDQQQ